MKDLLVILLFLEFLVDHSFCGSVKGSLPSNIDAAIGEFTHHETVVPNIFHHRRKRATTLHQGSHTEEFTLELQAFNKTFHLNLQQNKKLLGRSFTVKYFDENGREVIQQPHNNSLSHCFYHGKMRGAPEAIVALSTCEGIRGQISLSDQTYYIEPSHPQGRNSQGLHFMFQESHRIPTGHKCGYDHNLDDFSAAEIYSSSNIHSLPQHRHKRSLHWPYDTSNKTRIVELYVANDYRQYERNGHNISRVIQRTKDIVNIVSSLYRPLNIYVALVGMEIWTRGDLIDVVENAAATMNNFLEYRRTKISPVHKNDNAQLITGREFKDGVVGKAVKSTICSWQYSGGVDMDHSELVGPVATTVAHEMGHNFGMQHDYHTCKCEDEKCIMAASSSGKNPTKWSSCSKEQLGDAFHQGLDYCLQNLPDELYDGPVCGNGFLEPGEQCDCGLLQDCSTHCCNGTTCQLTVNATCATGACCDLNTCQPKQATTECRPSHGECDLPEFCDGESEFCPSDVHVRNGLPCKRGKTYCYMGQCNTHDSQCQMLWGPSGQMAHKLCFEHFNIMGLANGHCGFNWVDKTFQHCKPEDTLCGMVHCTHRAERLRFWKEALAYTMPEAWVMVNDSRQECKGAILDVGLSMRDPGLSPQGAKCGNKKICVDQKCQPISQLEIPACPDCHGNGICNSIGQCHCFVGYMPPYCDETGHGGSIHSGPIQIMSTNTSLIVALVLLFLVIIPAIVVSLICFCCYRQQLKKIWNSRPYIKYDFLHRAKRSEPNTTPVHKRPETQPPQMVACTAVSSPVGSTTSSGPDRTKRQSFRGVEISNPALQFCTKTSQSLENMTDVGTGDLVRPLSHIDEAGETTRFLSFSRPQQWGASQNHSDGPSVSASSAYYQNATEDGALSPRSRPPERPPPTYMEKLKPPKDTTDMSPPTPPPPPLKPRRNSSGRQSTPPQSTPYYGNVDESQGPQYENLPEDDAPPLYHNVVNSDSSDGIKPLSPPPRPVDTPLGQIGLFSTSINDKRKNFERDNSAERTQNGPRSYASNNRPERPSTKPNVCHTNFGSQKSTGKVQPKRPPPLTRSSTTAGGPKPTINGPARPGMSRSQSTTGRNKNFANSKPAVLPKPSTLLSKNPPQTLSNGPLQNHMSEDSHC